MVDGDVHAKHFEKAPEYPPVLRFQICAMAPRKGSKPTMVRIMLRAGSSNVIDLMSVATRT
jgi:hypothetical protein